MYCLFNDGEKSCWLKNHQTNPNSNNGATPSAKFSLSTRQISSYIAVFSSAATCICLSQVVAVAAIAVAVVAVTIVAVTVVIFVITIFIVGCRLVVAGVDVLSAVLEECARANSDTRIRPLILR
jgi:hypothetical protein